MVALRRLGPAMTLVALVIAVLILADGVLAIKLASTHSSAPAAASSRQTASGHPCNHGFYVSQAAHAKKGGKYVSGVAHGDLGKNGSCSAPLPN